MVNNVADLLALIACTRAQAQSAPFVLVMQSFMKKAIAADTRAKRPLPSATSVLAIFVDTTGHPAIALADASSKSMRVVQVGGSTFGDMTTCTPETLSQHVHSHARVKDEDTEMIARALTCAHTPLRNRSVGTLLALPPFQRWVGSLSTALHEPRFAQGPGRGHGTPSSPSMAGTPKSHPVYYVRTATGTGPWGSSACTAHVLFRVHSPPPKDTTKPPPPAKLWYLMQARNRKLYPKGPPASARRLNVKLNVRTMCIAGLPGGHADKGDTGPVRTALRELDEECIPISEDEFRRALVHVAYLQQEDVDETKEPEASRRTWKRARAARNQAMPGAVRLTSSMKELQSSFEATQAQAMPQVLPSSRVVFVLDLWRLNATHGSRAMGSDGVVHLPPHGARPSRTLIAPATDGSSNVRTTSELDMGKETPRGYMWVPEHIMRGAIKGQPHTAVALGIIQDKTWRGTPLEQAKTTNTTHTTNGTLVVMDPVCGMALRAIDTRGPSVIPVRPSERSSNVVIAFHVTRRNAMRKILNDWERCPSGVGVLKPSSGGMLGPMLYLTDQSGVSRFINHDPVAIKDYFVLRVRVRVGTVSVQRPSACQCSATCGAIGVCHDGRWAWHADCHAFMSTTAGHGHGSEIAVANVQNVTLESVFTASTFREHAVPSPIHPSQLRAVVEGTEKQFLQAVSRDDVASMWSGSYKSTKRRVKKRRRVTAAKRQRLNADDAFFGDTLMDV